MRKIILIGIEGASWDVINYLLNKDSLPTFKRLINNGAKNKLYNINMIDIDPWENFYVFREYVKNIPRIGNHPDALDWMTLATGVMPDKHGVITSTEKNNLGIEFSISLKKRRKPAIWEILARYNRKIGIIGWMANWPPPHLSYYSVARISDIAVPSFSLGFKNKSNQANYKNGSFLCNPTYPHRLWEELKKIHYDSKIDKFFQQTFPFSKGRSSKLIKCDSLYLEWAKYLLKRFPQPDFLAVCLYGVHFLSHFFWDCLKLERKNFRGIIHQKRQKKYGFIIENYYKYLDKKIGEVMRLIDKNSIVMIVSNNNMVRSHIIKKYFQMNKIYEELGFLKFRGGNNIDKRNTSVYDNQNPWGIFSIRKGYIKGKNPEKIFHCLARSLKKIKTERKEPLFFKIDFNKKDNSFTVIPNYKAIHYFTKIFLNGKAFAVKELIDFLPHYSLHGPEGMVIVSGKNKTGFSLKSGKTTNLDIVPTILYLLGIKYKDVDLKGKVILS
jgi:predicted AlkP superfamily phosphohydrolase/phosphomutase